jgi:putative transposase
MSMPGYWSGLSDEQWALLEPLLNVPGKRGRKYGDDIRDVVDAVLYVTYTGCQWRQLPRDFGPWTRVWSQFRRWSANGTWARLLAELHRQARVRLGRSELPSMVVMDTHLARGASVGGVTFHRRGGPCGRTNGARRAVAVDVTGLPLAAAVLRASAHENEATQVLLEGMGRQGQRERLGLVKVDKGVTKRATAKLGRMFGVSVERVGHAEKKATFVPLAFAWRVEVAHGQLLRQRRLARSFENTEVSATGWLLVASIKTVLDAMTAPGFART